MFMRVMVGVCADDGLMQWPCKQDLDCSLVDRDRDVSYIERAALCLSKKCVKAALFSAKTGL